jgi:branched-chain amino acid transport system ATP-binding protein
MANLLEIRGLTKTFGGLIAVDNLDMTITQGNIVGLVGPNGSGKTTLFNLVTGFLRADLGKIIFRGKDITKGKPHEIVALGVGRTWQLVNPFRNYTVYDNVKVSCLMRGTVREKMEGEVLRTLDLSGIGEYKNAKAGNLSIGNLKRLEIARALATGPELLLLDEPFGGLTHGEIQGLKLLISALQNQGKTILLVEHLIREILELVNKLFVLNFGKLLAAGPPVEVVKDSRVIEAYLGRGYDAGG